MTDSAAAMAESKLIEQGMSLLDDERIDEANAISKRLLEDFPESATTLNFASDVELARGNVVGSGRLAKSSMDKFPQEHGGAVLYCRALYALGKNGEARELALSLAGRDLTDARHLQVVVTILLWSLEPEAAYPLCQKAVAINSGDAAPYRDLAVVCQAMGKLEEAEAAANAVLRLEPHDYDIIQLRTALRKATPESNNIAALEPILAAGCDDYIGAAKVAYSLAKETEDIGRYDDSFRFLNAAAGFRRHEFNYDVAEDLRTFEAVRTVMTAEAMAGASAGHDSDEPIFILGLPRTGSTLLERIIASHSAVFAAGELNDFTGAMMEEVRKQGAPSDATDLIAKSIAVDMAALGQRYIEMTRPLTGHTPRFIDKLPANSLYIGNIHMALPRASIIHVRRTPLDACYAIYKFLFNMAYPWSYNMDEIAAYYIAYRGLMDHWRAVLPGRIIDIAYEDLVEDLEGETRGLIETLGLPWEPACLEFEKNTAAALTGSATQVRQKIYSSSVGRWKDYEAQLQPLADKLEAAGIDPYTP